MRKLSSAGVTVSQLDVSSVCITVALAGWTPLGVCGLEGQLFQRWSQARSNVFVLVHLSQVCSVACMTCERRLRHSWMFPGCATVALACDSTWCGVVWGGCLHTYSMLCWLHVCCGCVWHCDPALPHCVSRDLLGGLCGQHHSAKIWYLAHTHQQLRWGRRRVWPPCRCRPCPTRSTRRCWVVHGRACWERRGGRGGIELYPVLSVRNMLGSPAATKGVSNAAHVYVAKNGFQCSPNCVTVLFSHV
jgi:hypothetical protein